MKHIVFIISMSSLCFGACKTVDKNESPIQANKTVEIVDQELNTETDNAKMINADVPKFTTPASQQFAEAYTAYINEIVAAKQTNDLAKLQELRSKQIEWQGKVQNFAHALSAEDAALWQQYSQATAMMLKE